MMSLLQIFVDNPWTTILVIILSIIGWKWLQRPRNLPPGPRGWPVIGAVSELSHSLHYDFERLGRQYGDIFSIQVANTLMVVLNSHRLIKEAFVTKANEFSDRPFSNMWVLSEASADFAAFEHSEKFREQKKFANQALRVGSKSMEDKIQYEIDHIADILEAKGGKPTDILEYLAKATGNIICSLLFSVRYDFDDPQNGRVNELSRNFLNVFMESYMYLETPPLIVSKILFRKHIKKVQKVFEDMREFCRPILKEHKETFDPDNVRDFLDVYIKEGKLDDRGFMDTALVFLPDSTDTIALVVIWALLFIAHDDEIQKKIQKEIDDVTGGSRKVTLQDKVNMPFTEATILETFRRSTAVAMTGFHKAKRGATLDGYNIPEYASVIANTYSAHMDEKMWKDPKVFRPERFLDSDGKVMKSDAVVLFGIGPRMCLGAQMSKMEVFLFVSTLLQRFTFTFPEDKPKPSLQPQQPEEGYRRPVPFEFCLTPR